MGEGETMLIQPQARPQELNLQGSKNFCEEAKKKKP